MEPVQVDTPWPSLLNLLSDFGLISDGWLSQCTWVLKHAHKSPHFPPNPCNLFSDISHFESFHLFSSSTLSVSPHLLLFMNSSIRLHPRSSYPPSLFPSVNHGTLILLLLAGDVELNPGPSPLNFTHLNIRSIRSFQKSSSLHNYLADHPTEILSLNETWLQPTDSDNFVSSLAPPGYSILHSPRLTGQGGGLALIFVHSWNSNFSALATYLHMNLSNLWLLNFQLATWKPSFLTSIVLHLPKYLLFFRNSRTYSKFLFHHHLSSSSVVTSISMLLWSNYLSQFFWHPR